MQDEKTQQKQKYYFYVIHVDHYGFFQGFYNKRDRFDTFSAAFKRLEQLAEEFRKDKEINYANILGRVLVTQTLSCPPSVAAAIVRAPYAEIKDQWGTTENNENSEEFEQCMDETLGVLQHYLSWEARESYD